MKSVWLDGELVAWDQANVHVTTLALHYGIGFFEGIRCHGTADGPTLFRLADHLARLERSVAIYGVGLPYSVAELARACKSVVMANGLTDCYLRPLLFLGEGLNPLAAKLRCVIIASEHGPLVGAPKEGGVAAHISAFQRFGANVLPPAAKASGQYLNAFLGQADALRSGYQEALFLNDQGFLADGWAHNVFVVTGGVLVTPPIHAGALPGITRDTVLRLAAETGIPTAERPLVRSDLYTAEECFLTGTATGVKAVASVDHRPMTAGAPGPITARMSEALAAVMTGVDGAHPEWRELVTR
jgi:branched-chain amino acid aminotransferase